MVTLTPFEKEDFERLIAWIDNEQLLMAIAGSYFSYPLTGEQLEAYLNDENSIAFNIVATDENKVIGHAEIIKQHTGSCKIDKLLIGDASIRGKGIGGMVIQALLDHCFNKLHADEVELNVYDWNIAGIKCYEKAGFADSGKRMETIVGNGIWTAINMIKSNNTVI